MTEFYVPLETTEQWRMLLAEPDKHWKEGRSAMSMATAWTQARGFPAAVMNAFHNADSPHLREASFVMGFPERKVDLPGGSRPSQTDLMVIARTSRGSAILAVEGKVDEPFGPLVKEWKLDASPGKTERLEFLCSKLGIRPDSVQDCRYQLLHRTASAILEAEQFHAKDAIVLVHSFDMHRAGFEDYSTFLSCFNLQAHAGKIQRARTIEGIELHFGWATECQGA